LAESRLPVGSSAGLVDERARVGGALHLPAAELMRQVRGAIAEADEREHLFGPRPRAAHRLAREQQGKRDVFQNGHGRKQMEELKDDAEPAPAVFGERGVIGRVECEAIDDDFAARWLVEAADEVHEGALPAATRPGDGNEFARGDVEGDIVERDDGAVAPGDVVKLNHEI
jgi:hypothetical protein